MDNSINGHRRRSAGAVLFTARPFAAGVFVVWLCAGSLAVQAESTAAPPLSLGEAVQLALDGQPLLERIEAQARAAREAAVAAAQLPDPQLFGGVQDLPVDGREAYSLSDDSDTQLVVGISQEFPRAQKRRLRGEVRLQQAQRLDDERAVAARAVQRDVSVAWLDVWQAQRAHAIAEATLRDAELQARSVQAAAGAGTAPPADLAMARVNTERYRDAVAARAQSIATARAVLSRWIGAEADRPIPDEAPPSAVAPDVAALLASLPEHPELAALQARVDEADVDARLADVAHAPDWRVEVGYGNRRDYSDMVLLKVGMDLPLFRRDRQDRDLASALALRDAARAEREDATRRLAAEVRRAYVELLALTAREHGYQTVIVPQTGSVIDAALAAWRSGSGSLAQVLEARRTRLDAQLAQLDLAADAARARIELVYLTGTGAQS